jgi:hypothetical protein
MEELQKLPEDEPRVIIAASKYVGGRFWLSYSGYTVFDTSNILERRVKQYAGRLHQDYHEKKKSASMITLIRRLMLQWKCMANAARDIAAWVWDNRDRKVDEYMNGKEHQFIEWKESWQDEF